MDRRKRIIAYLLTVSLLFTSSGKRKKNDNIKYEDKEFNGLYSSYSNGDVYIVNKKYIDEFITDISDNDILVYDYRYTDNPDMKIINSYKINDLKIMREILNILLEYENEYSSGWDRSIDSMLNEWYIHNMFSWFNIFINRTYDVDLDNRDEILYKVRIFNNK